MIVYLIVDKANLPIAIYDDLASAFNFIKYNALCKVIAWCN